MVLLDLLRSCRSLTMIIMMCPLRFKGYDHFHRLFYRFFTILIDFKRRIVFWTNFENGLFDICDRLLKIIRVSTLYGRRGGYDENCDIMHDNL